MAITPNDFGTTFLITGATGAITGDVLSRSNNDHATYQAEGTGSGTWSADVRFFGRNPGMLQWVQLAKISISNTSPCDGFGPLANWRECYADVTNVVGTITSINASVGV